MPILIGLIAMYDTVRRCPNLRHWLWTTAENDSIHASCYCKRVTRGFDTSGIKSVAARVQKGEMPFTWSW
jgi:hypothetical protein